MLLVSLTLALAAADPGIDAPIAAAQSAEPAETKKEKKICKVDPANTGSRMKQKLCLTETEWAKRKVGKNVGDLKVIGGR